MSAPFTGLTKQLIDDLFDLVHKFGRAVEEGPYIFIAVTRPKLMLASMSAIFGDRRLYLTASHDDETDGVPIVVQLDERGGVLVWDDALTVADAQDFIAAVDELFRATPGAFGPDGLRERVDHGLSAALFMRSVDATFVTPGDLMRVPPFALEALKAQFDKPDELAIFKDHFGDTNLCRAAHLAEIGVRDAARQRVFERWGIEDRAGFATLDPETMERIRLEYLKEIEADPN